MLASTTGCWHPIVETDRLLIPLASRAGQAVQIRQCDLSAAPHLLALIPLAACGFDGSCLSHFAPSDPHPTMLSALGWWCPSGLCRDSQIVAASIWPPVSVVHENTTGGVPSLGWIRFDRPLRSACLTDAHMELVKSNATPSSTSLT
jgi:hypothetical protein